MEIEGIEDDIFDRNIDQIDVRETPRCELTEEEDNDEEEESGQSDVDTLINQQNPAIQDTNAAVLAPMNNCSGYGKVVACDGRPQGAVANQCCSPKLKRQPNLATKPVPFPTSGQPVQKVVPGIVGVPAAYSLSNKMVAGSANLSSAHAMGSNKSGKSVSSSVTMSPKLSGGKLDKNQVDKMMDNAYLDDSDCVKDFSAEDRAKETKQKQLKELKVGSNHSLISPSKSLRPWEDDVDSIKDFSGSFRQKEEKYMYRTDEAIYQRATEEHIKRPPAWHDEEVDSVRDFGHISNKHEIPSGQTSLQISRMPSDEDLCLSPPWFEEDDGLVRDFAEMNTDDKNYSINEMVSEERMRQIPVFRDDEKDSTRDYSTFRRTGTAENSRRPSSENIYLTPPWMEEGSCAESDDHQPPQITLDEHRAIEEEARNAGLSDAGEKVEAIRDSSAQASAAAGTSISGPQPGRDSGFCSEQDQHAQQGGAALGTEQSDHPAAAPTTEVTTTEPLSSPVKSNPSTVGVSTSICPMSLPSSTMPHVVPSSNPLVNLARANFCRPALVKQDQASASSSKPMLVPSMAAQSKLPGNAVPSNAAHPGLGPSSMVPVHKMHQNLGPGYVAPVSVGYTNMRPAVAPKGNLPSHQGPLIQRGTNASGYPNQSFGPVSSVPTGKRPPFSQHEVTNNEILRRGSAQGQVPISGGQELLSVPTTAAIPVAVDRNQPRDTHPAHHAAGLTMYGYESTAKDSADVVRSISQSSLEAMCYSPHDALEGFETTSVISFASTAATHHDLDTKTDMVQSLLSMLGTHDKDDMSRTLLAMSNSKDSCAAMRQSGCLPLLIDLLHGQDFENEESRREARARAGLALHNIVYSHVDDRRGRREVRVLRLLEIVRAHCDVVQYKDTKVHACAARWYPPLRDHGPGPAVAALMKLSFEDEHRNAICDLGGLQAIAELVEIDHKVNGGCKDPYSISLRKYTGMTLTNLTFGQAAYKKLLCNMKGTLEALVAQLATVEEEEVIQMAACVLKNLSWRTDENCRQQLREAGVVKALVVAAQNVHGEPALRTILSALWNFSAHCAENKVEICEISGALRFLVKCLNYCSPSSNLSVIESSGGILRNLSSHVALRADYRQLLRENGCFQTLLTHLRSPSLRIISNACGALWNLSARCTEDQELLWELGAVSILKSLVNSKHKVISTSSSAALRNLMAVKPGSSQSCTDNESVTSRHYRRYRSMPSESRTAQNQAKLKSAKWGKSTKINSQRTAYDEARPLIKKSSKKSDSSTSLKSCHSSSSSNGGDGHSYEASPLLSRSRSDIGPSSLLGRLHKAKYAAVPNDAGSASSGCSVDGRPPLQTHTHMQPKWSDGNDSLARHRRQTKASVARGKFGVSSHGNASDIPCGSPRQSSRKMAGNAPGDRKGHTRSSSDTNVIQLATDSYPLHVTAKPAKKTADQQHDKHPSNNVPRQIGPIAQIGYHYLGPSASGSPTESQSIVSPGTARRLNKWMGSGTKEENEIPMVELATRLSHDQNPLQHDITSDDPEDTAKPYQNRLQDNASQSPSGRGPRRRLVQRFRSYRDSGSEPEADIDSDDERNLFHAQKSPARVEVKNAWLGKARTSHSSPTTTLKGSKCTCDAVPNVWVRRAETGAKSSGMCESCSGKSKRDHVERSNSISGERRNSADSAKSGTQGVLKIFKRNSGRESRRKSGSNKSSLKVTSL